MDKAVEETRSIQPVTGADLRAARHADERLFADSWASTDIISDRVLFLILALEGSPWQGKRLLVSSLGAAESVAGHGRVVFFVAAYNALDRSSLALKSFEPFFPC